MATKFAGYLVLALVTASVFYTAMANKNSSCPPCPCTGGGGGGNWGPPMAPHKPQTINVGGSEIWRYGVDYAAWAWNYSMNTHFFVGDTLVFKYFPEYGHNHSVYLLPNIDSYRNCDLTNAKQIGKPGGGANGVEFTLTAKKKPYEDPHFYFSCGEGVNGSHCRDGKMKFIVYPLPHY
ncbi:hypothetical protein CASFOL_020766 [Castilleja foliolosa]|uniref:Phytocyanin domain-containing protein n=1 Tax=Castilleja foliolosa TaxID=1961234 RepID=A0ABD3D4R7_9LAMI